MKITFTSGPGVKVIQYSEGVVINEPEKNGRVVPAVKSKGREEPGRGSQGIRTEVRRKEKISLDKLRAGLKIRPEEIEDEKLAEEVAILHQIIERPPTTPKARVK